MILRATLLAVLAAGFALAPATAAERIQHFASAVSILEDASFVVEERILYDFGAESRHGIYRDIPVRYGRGAAADYRIVLDVETVTDADGRARPFATFTSGDDVRIRIGSKQRKVTGKQEYRIRYRVRRGLLWFDDHDEFYWNATGTGWRVPVASASTTVTLPAEADAPLQALCFTGAFRSVESDCAVRASHRDVAIQTTRPLGAREGLTVVLAIPKGLLAEPSAARKFLDRASDYVRSPMLLPFVVAIACYGWWRRNGRDPAGPDVIPVRYEPPEGMTPAEMGTVLDERVDMDDITASILDLAVRGYLQIEETESTKFFAFSHTDYTLHRSTKDASSLKLHERDLLTGLFAGQPSVSLSSLEKKFYTRLPGIRDALYREVSKDGGWFPTRPDRVRSWHMALAGVAMVAALVIAVVTGNQAWLIPVGLSGAVAIAFGWIMPRKTRRGRRARQEILGFQEFIERVEKDRLERIGLDDVSKFELLLPYAFVLGVADAWAETFADLYTQPPNWYVTHDGGPFRPRRFVSRVGRSLAAANSTLKSQPSGQRGSGGSGFGGGGFSGGGFGGGGGGSW